MARILEFNPRVPGAATPPGLASRVARQAGPRPLPAPRRFARPQTVRVRPFSDQPPVNRAAQGSHAPFPLMPAHRLEKTPRTEKTQATHAQDMNAPIYPLLYQ